MLTVEFNWNLQASVNKYKYQPVFHIIRGKPHYNFKV